MFIDFISRILGAEKVSVSNRLENNAEPSVIVTKDSNKTSPKPIPEKYRKDVALLQSKYGDAFKNRILHYPHASGGFINYAERS